MNTVSVVQENAEDILADAKAINEEREAEAEAAEFEDFETEDFEKEVTE